MSIRKNSLGILSLLLTSTLFLFTQCNPANIPSEDTAKEEIPQEEQEESSSLLAVRPPIQGVNVPFQKYKVPVDEGMTIKIETGTVIKIPAQAFVDKDGNPVTGEVEISYREFHDAADVIASGIPMVNPETGEYMETAGMFEIRGKQDGQEVFVKEEKNISIDLASYNEGADFDFFELGEKDCHWKTLISSEGGQLVPQVNTARKEGLAKLDKELPNRPIRPVTSDQTKNFVFDLDVNYSKFPELKPFKGIVWEYIGTKNEDNPEKNDWIFKVDWDKITLNKDASGDFKLVLNKLGKDDKRFATNVRPVLQGKDMKKALASFESKMAEYQKIAKLQQGERERLGNEAKLLRSLMVSGFGIFNCDKWTGRGNILCYANFSYEGDAEVVEDVNRMTVYLVTKSRRGILRLGTSRTMSFRFSPNDENTLVAVLPNSKIAVFSSKDFAALDLEKVENKEYDFQLKTSDITIKSVEDLRDVIDKLG
ncbi:MAG: hypothetical protein GY810_23040 [Aureispira sp.]|nr:hypothetical protein [Aureispira sp.]